MAVAVVEVLNQVAVQAQAAQAVAVLVEIQTLMVKMVLLILAVAVDQVGVVVEQTVLVELVDQE
jgi:hypothetical protein